MDTKVKDFLKLLMVGAFIKVHHFEMNEDYIFVGKAQDCPYWIADLRLDRDGDGWFVDKEGYLVIQCSDWN